MAMKLVLLQMDSVAATGEALTGSSFVLGAKIPTLRGRGSDALLGFSRKRYLVVAAPPARLSWFGDVTVQGL